MRALIANIIVDIDEAWAELRFKIGRGLEPEAEGQYSGSWCSKIKRRAIPNSIHKLLLLLLTETYGDSERVIFPIISPFHFIRKFLRYLIYNFI